ncbi:MAG: hypothetical protein AAFN09_15255 [Pseudomonadota bacterium]
MPVTVAFAQGTIRSGEHGDFTRLVVPVPEIESWDISGENGFRNLQFTPEIELNDQQIFELIDRSRLLDVEVAPGRLSLQLDCDCSVEAYVFQDIYLVIDISDGPPISEPETTPSDPSAIDSITPNESATATRVQETSEVEAPDTPEDRLRPQNDQQTARFQPLTPLRRADTAPSSSATALLLANLEPFLDPTLPATSDVEQSDQDASMAVDIEAAAQNLSEQLARAAAAGLLQIAPLEPFTTGDQPAETQNTDPEASAPAPVRAANAFDVVLDRDSGLNAAARALTCTDHVDDISNWSSDIGFDQELGRLRQDVIDDRGNIIDTRALELARYYIFYGFGAEAEYWLLQMRDPPSPEVAIARFLDGIPGPNFPPIQSLAFCSAQDLLWRYIDDPEMQTLAERQIQEMQLAFLNLPQTLRGLIGPDYVLRLSQDGHQAAAEDIREALSTGTALTRDEELFLALETGALPVESADLGMLAATLQNGANDRLDAMVQYLSVARRQNEIAGDTQVIAAEALLREAQPPITFGGLWHELVLSHAIAERNDRLFEMLDGTNLSTLTDGTEILTSIFRTILRYDNDSATLILATRTVTQPGPDALPSDVRDAIFTFLDRTGLDAISAAYARQQFVPNNQTTPTESVIGAQPAHADAARLLESLRTSSVTQILEPTALRERLDDTATLRSTISALLVPEDN